MPRPKCPIGLLVQALCLHGHRPTPSRLSPRMSRPNAPPCVTGQDAYQFNQPLSFDTSSVTDMTSMFWVRSARASPPMSSWDFLAPCLHRHRLPPSHCARSAFGPHASLGLVTRQGASAFNQPLSFDTSIVKDMSYMFSVRLAPNVPLMSNWSPLCKHSACTATGPRPPASRPACRALMRHLV